MAGFAAHNRFATAGGNVHDRGRQPLPLRIGDDERDARINRGDGGIGGA